MKNFPKTMNWEIEAFKHSERKLHLSDAKIKEEIFFGSQIFQLLKEEAFNEVVQRNQKAAWKSFRSVVDNFLGN